MRVFGVGVSMMLLRQREGGEGRGFGRTGWVGGAAPCRSCVYVWRGAACMYVEGWLCAWLWVVWLAVGTLLSACLLMQSPQQKQAHRAYTCEARRAEESDCAVSVGGVGCKGGVH